ncbi:MAG: ABC-F family ATP-binding cassette domain-containing protein [Pseudomonadota bacterium]
MLTINNLTYRIAGRTIFDRASVGIPTGERVGIVGRNGTGKSTLLRLIAGDIHPDGGDISTASRMKIGSVAQEAPDGEESLLDTVLAADVERTTLLAELETTEDGMRIAEIHTRLLEIDAASAPARAGIILSGLGFSAAAQQGPVGALSGGFRMRVALAAALFAEPDLLLLDEPTNHLDIEAALWLEGFLKSYQHTILLVSHDRTLLNSVVQRTLHVDRGALTLYQGGYDQFERTRRERMEHASAQQAKQVAERRRIEGFIERFRAKASKARQAQSRIKMLEKMQPIADIAADGEIRFDSPSPAPLPPPIVAMEEAQVGYEPGKPVLRNQNLRIDQDDRIALLGPNGNGKSTLAKLISQRLTAMNGQVRRSGKLKVGYFAQHQQDELDLKATPIEHMARLRPMETETKWRGHIARFGLGKEKAETKVGSLSGGCF